MMRANRPDRPRETYWWDELESVYEQMYNGKTADFTSKTAAIESKINELLAKNIAFFEELN